MAWATCNGGLIDNALRDSEHPGNRQAEMDAAASRPATAHRWIRGCKYVPTGLEAVEDVGDAGQFKDHQDQEHHADHHQGATVGTCG